MASGFVACFLCPGSPPIPTAALSDHVGSFHSKYRPMKCAYCDRKGTRHQPLLEHQAQAHPDQEPKVAILLSSDFCPLCVSQPLLASLLRARFCQQPSE